MRTRGDPQTGRGDDAYLDKSSGMSTGGMHRAACVAAASPSPSSRAISSQLVVSESTSEVTTWTVDGVAEDRQRDKRAGRRLAREAEQRSWASGKRRIRCHAFRICADSLLNKHDVACSRRRLCWSHRFILPLASIRNAPKRLSRVLPRLTNPEPSWAECQSCDFRVRPAQQATGDVSWAKISGHTCTGMPSLIPRTSQNGSLPHPGIGHAILSVPYALHTESLPTDNNRGNFLFLDRRPVPGTRPRLLTDAFSPDA
uniref:Uncharacterized protein n=1 Tax=Mycena chlorophos TaxID=658473 RepID=A0ABQ0KUA6_MYCCL|nr:predicted protein [Mycena chlorophos]